MQEVQLQWKQMFHILGLFKYRLVNICNLVQDFISPENMYIYLVNGYEEQPKFIIIMR